MRIPRIRACLTKDWIVRPFSRTAKADLAERLQAALLAPDDAWTPFWFCDVPVRARVIHDSLGDEAKGYGVMVDGKVYQGRWAPTVQTHSSAYRELVPILLAAQLMCSASPPA